MNYAKFGPSGHSQSFTDEGYTATIQMPAWLKARGLELFEYSFGRGVRVSTATAAQIGEEADKYGIELSVHAPYFINFASPEMEKSANSINYLLSSLKVLKAFGGKRCVFHTGAEGGQPREEAFSRAKSVFSDAVQLACDEGYGDLLICPETMGKQAQIGTVDEVIELCKVADNVYPCIDFGHINALYGGTLKAAKDFEVIVKKMFDGVGDDKTKNMHVHFSKIQYGAKGEIRHLTFSDNVFGPEFEPFAEIIAKYSLTPHVLSESAGTQAEDAAYMQNVYRNLMHV